MKKSILFGLSVLMIFSGCKKTEYEGDVIEGNSFVGHTVVTYNGADVTSEKEVTVELKQREDAVNQMDILMYKVKFVPNMPVSVDIVIPGVPYIKKDGKVMFAADGIVPTWGNNIPYEKFKVTNLDGYYENGHLHFSLNFGAYPTTFDGDRQ